MSKKKRIKKLVKGHLTSKDAAGADIYAAGTVRQNRLAAIDAMNEADLLTALVSASGGDADSVAFADDAFPFDARESRDTDGDNIGDNRDILLEKIQADAIFVRTINNVTQGASAGTLEVATAKLQTVATDIAAIADSVDDGDTQRAALLALQGDTDYTLAGVTALLATVRQGRTDYLAIKAKVDAMTATAGVTIDVAAPYNGLDCADKVAGDMATDGGLGPNAIGQEGVSGRSNDAKVAHDAIVSDLTEIAAEP